KQILEELDRKRSSEAQSTPQGEGNRRPSVRIGPRRRRRSMRPDANQRTPKAPDPVWEPDLVFLDEPPLETRPPRPPDPDWQPDLILLEEMPRDRSTPDAAYGWINHVPWLRRGLEHSIPDDSESRSEWAGTVRWVVGLALLVVIYGLGLLFLF